MQPRAGRDVAAGRVNADKIDERAFAQALYVPELPDVDMVLRTSGEQRFSNFMLWQSAYAEMVFMDVLWPDVDRRTLYEAIDIYARRDRRYGSARARLRLRACFGTGGRHPALVWRGERPAAGPALPRGRSDWYRVSPRLITERRIPVAVLALIAVACSFSGSSSTRSGGGSCGRSLSCAVLAAVSAVLWFVLVLGWRRRGGTPSVSRTCSYGMAVCFAD